MYLDLLAALSRCKERSGATAQDDAFLTEMLTFSAGVDLSQQTHYRPFYVAAKYLEQSQSAQAISEDDGTKFTGLAKPIASLLALQAPYDVAQALTIPAGFEAATSQSKAFRIQGTRSQPTQIRP